MILRSLKNLHKFLNNLNPANRVDLHTCLTVQVENLHAMSHFKNQLQTALRYARNLANTIYESIKRVVPWVADYFTHDSSYYPVVEQTTPLHAILRMSHLKPINEAAQCQTEGADERIGFLQWKGRPSAQRASGDNKSLTPGHFLLTCTVPHIHQQRK